MTEQIAVVEKTSNKKLSRHILIVLAVLALLSAIFSIAQLKNSERHLNNMLKENDKQIGLLTTQLQSAQQQLTQLQQNTTVWRNEIQQKIASQLTNIDHSTWVLAEVNYLVQLASYQLTFSNDAAIATALLQTADQRLVALNNVSMQRIRTVLANLLTTLRVVPKVDMAGLLARIHALQLQATQLPLLVPASNVVAKNNFSMRADTTLNWREKLKKNWENLQKLVVIRHYDQPVVPLLPQEQQAYLQQNLQLLLQQAQWAVLQHQEAVYQSSLQQAQKWVVMYFANNAETTQAMLKAIKELQQISVQPKTPDVSNLLQQVQQMIAVEMQYPATTNKSS